MPRYAIIAGYSMAINASASLLDIGCGTGHLWSRLSPQCTRRYVGIDVSTVAIHQARQRAASSQARFKVANATTFIPDERFDIIVFNEVLYYLAQPEQVLERYAGFLEPDGAFIISMYRSIEALRTWRQCAARLKVLDEVRLSGAQATEWNVWLCRPTQAGSHATG